MVRALCDVALDVGPDRGEPGSSADLVLGRIATARDDGRPCELGPAAVAALDDRWARARGVLARLGRDGIGVVALDEPERRGLAAGWAPAALARAGRPHVLAADGGSAVVVDDAGLHLVEAPASAPLALLGAIVDVVDVGGTPGGGGATLTIDGSTRELVPPAAALLASLVPGARRWRARHVPEVVTWADALAGASEAARVTATTGASAVVATVV